MVLALLPAAALASHAYPIEYKPLPTDCLYTPALCFQQAGGQALILVLLSFRGCPSLPVELCKGGLVDVSICRSPCLHSPEPVPLIEDL